MKDDRRADQFGPQPKGPVKQSDNKRIKRSSDKGSTAHESKGAK